MYDIARTEDLTKYTVIDSDGNILAVYANKFKARDHADCLNLGVEYIEKSNAYYESMG